LAAALPASAGIDTPSIIRIRLFLLQPSILVQVRHGVKNRLKLPEQARAAGQYCPKIHIRILRITIVITLLLLGGNMLTTIRRLGNSQGILIPKPLLQQVGLVDQAEMCVEGNALVLRRPKAAPRAGWAEECKTLAAAGDDVLALPEFANEGDGDLTW
jgi:antitoxin MazE